MGLCMVRHDKKVSGGCDYLNQFVFKLEHAVPCNLSLLEVVLSKIN